MDQTPEQKTVADVANIADSYHERMSETSVDWGGVTFRLRPLSVGALMWAQAHSDETARGYLQLQYCIADVAGGDPTYTNLNIDGEDFRCVELSWIKRQLPGLVTALIEYVSKRAGLHYEERIKLDFT